MQEEYPYNALLTDLIESVPGFIYLFIYLFFSSQVGAFMLISMFFSCESVVR